MSNKARELSLWTTPAATKWLQDAELDEELREQLIEALRLYRNDTEKKAKLEKRVKPYRTRLYATSLNKVVRSA